MGDMRSNYQKLMVKFEGDGKEYTLQGIKDYFPQASSICLEMVHEDGRLGKRVIGGEESSSKVDLGR